MKRISFLMGVICMLLLLDVIVLYKLRESHREDEIAGLLIEELQKENFQKQEIIEAKDQIEAFELINNDYNSNIDSILDCLRIENKQLLVFRFSSNSCPPCIDSIMVLIKDLPINLRKNVLLLSDYNSKRQFYTRFRYAGLDQFDYRVFDKLPLPFDPRKIPYFFIIDKNGIVRMFFIPDLKNKSRTLNYLNFIYKKYWSGTNGQ